MQGPGSYSIWWWSVRVFKFWCTCNGDRRWASIIPLPPSRRSRRSAGWGIYGPIPRLKVTIFDDKWPPFILKPDIGALV